MPKLLRTPGIIQQQEEIEREADKDADRAVGPILRELRRLREQVSEVDIEREVLAKSLDLEPLIKQVELDDEGLRLVFGETILRGLRTGRRISAGHVPADMREDAARAVSRDRVGPRGVRFAQRESANLVRQVSRSTRAAIRAEIVAGQRLGLRPERIAQEVRQIVGLDRRRAASVRNFRRAQERAGVDPEIIERRAGRMTNRLIRERAELIARTETFRAVNEGRNDMWDEMVEDGTIEEAEVVRIWITARDSRVDAGRPDGPCISVDGDQVGLREDFANGFFSPPAHPGCRCTLQYRMAS